MNASSVFEPVKAVADAQTDLEKLQGAWVSVLGNCDTELLVAGDHFAMRFRGVGEIYMGVFTIDPAARPRRMDMVVEEGPAARKGKTALCIYRFEDDTLHWCPAEPGSGHRPRAFPAQDDVKSFYTVFRRDWP